MVFTSDNGYLWGEHNLTSKFVPYRKAVEVPLLIRWPGHVAAGAVDPRWVAHVDISPTLLAAAGVTSTLTPMDGHDIFSGSGYVRPQAFTEYFLDESNGLGRPTWASIRSSTRQYTEYYDTAGAVTFREYYDMVNDPYQQAVNLLGDGNPANDPKLRVAFSPAARPTTVRGQRMSVDPSPRGARPRQAAADPAHGGARDGRRLRAHRGVPARRRPRRPCARGVPEDPVLHDQAVLRGRPDDDAETQGASEAPDPGPGDRLPPGPCGAR